MRTSLSCVAAVAVAVALLTACSTTQYVIGTKTGQLLISHGEPRLDKATNTYRFRDAEGKEMAVNAADVTQIIER
ncbi:MAG: YgdI/YgdR family lipoprotein [Burkholderiaceae bacterium]|nr:YgdI/YgdR family lipoprotein [Burkholderiaceae bacterium]